MKSATLTVEMVDGTTLSGRTIMPDMLRYEETAKRQKPPWGGISDNPAVWEAFVSWAALTREGKWSGTFEEWKQSVASIDFEFEDVRPTNGASSAVT